VKWRHAWSSSLDLGRIWRDAAVLSLVVGLWWQKPELAWDLGRSSSLNKGLCFPLWRPCTPVFCCNAGCSPMESSAMPSRWWCGEGGKVNEAFFNKQLLLLWSCGVIRRWPSPPAGHGGSKGGDLLMFHYNRSEGWGRSHPELIHVAGCCAAAICRRSGSASTSMSEALIRHRHGCSSPCRREVMRSPRRSGGPWWLLVVGRGLPSSRPLLLGGFAWRTPAKGDRDAQGLDCKLSYSSRVVFVKSKAFSIDRRFPRARLEKRAKLNDVPVTV
jgi:hypothetical protein